MNHTDNTSKFSYIDEVKNDLASKTGVNSFADKLSLSSIKFGMVLAALLVIFYNKSFFLAAAGTISSVSMMGVLFYISLIAVLWLLTLLSLNFILIPWLVKPLSILLLLASSVAAYFMDTYGVVIDKEMLRNVLETDAKETHDLLSLKLIMYVSFIGVLPSILVIKTRIVWKSFTQELIARAVIIMVALLISVVLILSFSSFYSSFFRNHKEVRFLTNPLGFIYGGVSLFKEMHKAPVAIDPIGVGSKAGVGLTGQTKPVLFVYVIGETARAENFGLSGYKRNTTPLLEKQNVAYFNKFSSCGTSTAVSLPCMFSIMPRAEYSDAKAKSQHGLLDFLNEAGINVLWRNNNSGCKGVCDRVNYETFPIESFPDLCKNGSCVDEILLKNLDEKLTGKNQIIVLHQKGSHGPAYDQRYPDSMRFYTPVCKTNQLQNCTREEVVNTYDNTIRYTDYFLNELLVWIKTKNDAYNTVMIYVSDHGESLGENRLYLHGMPYAVAPKTQTQVPFIFWASDNFYNERGIVKDCLYELQSTSYSHDNLFHSVLGLFDIKTDYYESKLDIFSPCTKRI